MLHGFLNGLGWTLGIGLGLLIIGYVLGLLIMAMKKH